MKEFLRGILNLNGMVFLLLLECWVDRVSYRRVCQSTPGIDGVLACKLTMAITSTQQRLKLYSKVPPDCLVWCCVCEAWRLTE